MMRPDYELYAVDVSDWTEHEVFNHLRKTFDDACRQFPEIMEPYEIRVAETLDKQETKALMRTGLRETFRRRRPSPYLPVDQHHEAAE